MRKLNTADIFRAARAVKASGLRSELGKLMYSVSKGENEIDLEKVGIDTILAAVEVFAEKNSEKAIYEVLSGPMECKPDDIEKMEISALMDSLEELSKDPGLLDFFKRLSGMIGRN